MMAKKSVSMAIKKNPSLTYGNSIINIVMIYDFEAIIIKEFGTTVRKSDVISFVDVIQF